MSGERSVQVLECFGGASFDVGVSVGRCGGVCFGEKVSSPFVVAGRVAFGEHRPPGEVGAGGEELGVCSVVERGGLGEVGVCFVVAAEDGGEAAEEVADRTINRYAGRWHLIGPRGEAVEQRPGTLRVPACDGDLGVPAIRAEPARVERKIEVGGSGLLQQATGVVDPACFDWAAASTATMTPASSG